MTWIALEEMHTLQEDRETIGIFPEDNVTNFLNKWFKWTLINGSSTNKPWKVGYLLCLKNSGEKALELNVLKCWVGFFEWWNYGWLFFKYFLYLGKELTFKF